MQTSDFQVFIDKFPCLKNNFLGVFSLDTIPTKMKCKTCLIFNDQIAEMPGRHWLALVHTKLNEYQIFDSYGVKIDVIKPYLKFKNPKFIYNVGTFQLPQTTTCGLYALYFCINNLLCNTNDFSDLLSSIFQINPEENERIVFNFFNDLN